MPYSVRGKNKNNSSYVKGAVLLLILIAIILFYRNMQTKGLPPQISSMLSSEFENYRNLKEIDSTLSDSLRRVFAGFWVYEIGDASSPVRITNHLELKDNGILWQVIRWDIRFLNSDTLSMYHVRQCYLNPYSMSSDTDDVICDIRIIRQSFIIGQDTCYGESHIDKMWRAKKTGTSFELNKNKFGTYTGELQRFFPDGLLDIVDNISIPDCRKESALTPYAKRFLEDNFIKSAATILPDNRSLVYEYYDKFLKSELIETLPLVSSIPGNINLVLTIQPDGKVSNVNMPGQNVLKSKVEEFVLKEAFSWVFPLRQATEASEVKYNINF